MTPAHSFVPLHRIAGKCKGGIVLPGTGYIQVHAYTSNAQIPKEGVAVIISDASGSPIAMRLTNRSGILDAPIPVQVPDISAGQTPATGVIPFGTVNISARLENFEAIEAENVQVFPGVVTVQNLELIPLSELPGSWNKLEQFNTPPQNL